jgi:hypothetical protein
VAQRAAKRAHRRETEQLREKLATATGEILILRERVRSLQTRTAGAQQRDHDDQI